jgi:hypothetical protein
MSFQLNLHVPGNTYHGRIENLLIQLYNEAANITSRELRTEKLSIINYALEFVRTHYESLSTPRRFTVCKDGVVTYEDAPASNLRIFF